jgi:hypothetical protein
MLAKSGRKGKPKDFMAQIRDFNGRRAGDGIGQSRYYGL